MQNLNIPQTRISEATFSQFIMEISPLGQYLFNVLCSTASMGNLECYMESKLRNGDYSCYLPAAKSDTTTQSNLIWELTGRTYFG